MDFAAFLSNLGNNLGFGLTVTLIGIAIVFLGLTILIGLIKLMEKATANLGKGGKKAKKQAEAPSRRLPRPWWRSAVADDSELIAVISAAVAMMMEDGSAFTVRRVRRVQNAPAWQKAGREEQVYSRF
ncbi:MAG: OadG family protein [Christensenellales bacterium]